MPDLIDREALKKACSEMVRGSNNSDFVPCPSWNDAMELIDNAQTVRVTKDYQWYDHIPKCVKARHGNYVLYQIDYLLDNLAREVYNLEWSKEFKVQTDLRGDDNV